MGSPALRLVYLDAVPSTSLARSHGQRIEVATVPRQHYNRSSPMTVPDGISGTTTETRSRSMRPLDQRWDRSRGIVFGRRPSITHDFRWSPSKPILYAEASGSRRGYAVARTTVAMPRSRAPSSRTTRETSRDAPGEITEQSFHGKQSIVVQEIKAQLVTSRGETAGERAKVRQLQQQLHDSGKKQHDLNAREATVRTKELQVQSESLKVTQDRIAIQSTLDEGREKARIEARKEVEEDRKSAQNLRVLTEKRSKEFEVFREQRLRELRVREENRLEEMDAESQKVQSDNDERLKAHFRQVSQTAKQLYERERKTFREDVLARKQDRADYEAYRFLWTASEKSLRRMKTLAILRQLRRTHDAWENIRSNFSASKPASLHQAYPELDGRLEQYLMLRQEQARKSSDSFDLISKQIDGAANSLMLRGHIHRGLTKHNRFTESPTIRDATVRLNNFAYTQVDDALLERRMELAELKTRIGATKDWSEKSSLRYELRQREDELPNLRTVQMYIGSIKISEALKALRSDSPLEKALFLALEPARYVLLRANGGIKALMNGYFADRVARRSATMMKEELTIRWRLIDTEVAELKSALRKKHLLDAHLAMSTIDQQSLDREIDDKIRGASEAGPRALRWRTALRRSPAQGTAVTLRRERRAKQREQEGRSVAEARDKRDVTISRPASVKQDEARMTQLNAEIASSPLGSEGRKERIQERDQVKLHIHKSELGHLNLKLKRSQLSPVARAHLEQTAVSLERIIAGSEAKSPDQTSTEEEVHGKQSTGPSEVKDQPKTTAATPKRRVSRHKEQRLARKNAREARSSSAEASPAWRETSPVSFSKIPSPSGYRSLNLQPTAPRQEVHVFMARLYHDERWEAMPAQGTLDLAALADGLKADRLRDEESSHGSGQSDHVQSRGASAGLHRAAPSSQSTSSNDGVDSTLTLLQEAEDLPSDDEVASTLHPSHEAETLPSNDEVATALDIQDRAEYLPSDEACMSSQGTADAPSAPIAVDEDFERTYHISPEDYRKAAIASPSTNAAFWTYKLYKNSHGQSPKIHYCTTYDQAENEAKYFLEQPIVGFDLEWEIGANLGKSSIKDCVSLIQIAAEDRIGLFQLALFKGETAEELLPPSLRALLESRTVAKAGVNVAGDARRLEKCLDVKIAGYFELSHLNRVVSYSETGLGEVNRKLIKLATQVQEILLLPLSKGQVRTSAWSKRLRSDQLEYAASDAYAGFQLYLALETRRKKVVPMPPRPGLWEDNEPLVLGDGQKVVAKAYVSKKTANSASKKAIQNDDDDDDEGDEYFDAPEDFEGAMIDSFHSAGVPLSGADVVYPSLPSLEDAVEGDEPPAFNQTATDEQPAATAPAKPPTRRQPPQSPEVTLAEEWATTWKASLPPEYNLKTGHAKLRAYHLWHQQSFGCGEAASLLRDPPLTTYTVASYVLDAVRDEDLQCERERVRELLKVLPEHAQVRYGKVSKRFGEGSG